MRETDRQAERERERDRDRQTDRQTDRQRDRIWENLKVCFTKVLSNRLLRTVQISL